MKTIIRELCNEDYHGAEEYRGYISSSMIKRISKDGIYEFAKQEKFIPSPTLDFGTACHAYFFEFDTFDDIVYVMEEERMNWTTREGKVQRDHFNKMNEAKEQVILWPADMVRIKAIWKNFELTYPAYAKQFRANQQNSELSVFVENWRGHKAKVRLDHYGESKMGATIFDLKTTFDVVTNKNVKREIAKYQYDVQDVMYREVTGADAFVFIFVKSTHPFTVQCINITNNYMLEGADLQIRYSLEQYEEYKANPDSILPTYEGGITEI